MKYNSEGFVVQGLYQQDEQSVVIGEENGAII